MPERDSGAEGVRAPPGAAVELHFMRGGGAGAIALVAIGEEEILGLIDSGMSRSASAILRHLQDHHRARTLNRPFLTHADVDPIGGVAAIKRATGARVTIGEEDAPALAGERRSKQIKGPLGWLFGLLTPLMNVDHVVADEVAVDGETLDGFAVIAVPGHTRGSLALWRERRRSDLR